MKGREENESNESEKGEAYILVAQIHGGTPGEEEEEAER